MSAEENKAVLRRVAEEIFNKGDLAVVDEVIASNYVYHGSGGQEYKSPEGFKQIVTMFRNAFPDLHMTVEDMVAEGDKVAHRLTIRGTHKGELMGIAPTGKQVTISAVTISRFAGGKEAEAWSNLDQLGMYQQLGVAPPTG
ncbi:MAG: ester cyclase [Dehalococcoidia bacterium]|nr:ester cyclase [Dehalococcoidia bacterium]